jgi:hypothetical protein
MLLGTPKAFGDNFQRVLAERRGARHLHTNLESMTEYSRQIAQMHQRLSWELTEATGLESSPAPAVDAFFVFAQHLA